MKGPIYIAYSFRCTVEDVFLRFFLVALTMNVIFLSAPLMNVLSVDGSETAQKERGGRCAPHTCFILVEFSSLSGVGVNMCFSVAVLNSKDQTTISVFGISSVAPGIIKMHELQPL